MGVIVWVESEALFLAASSSSKALSKASVSKSEDANFRLNIRRMSGGSLVSGGVSTPKDFRLRMCDSVVTYRRRNAFRFWSDDTASTSRLLIACYRTSFVGCQLLPCSWLTIKWVQKWRHVQFAPTVIKDNWTYPVLWMADSNKSKNVVHLVISR